jgi:hypothetical protein
MNTVASALPDDEEHVVAPIATTTPATLQAAPNPPIVRRPERFIRAPPSNPIASVISRDAGRFFAALRMTLAEFCAMGSIHTYTAHALPPPTATMLARNSVGQRSLHRGNGAGGGSTGLKMD